MYWVYYYCPRISESWLAAGGPMSYDQAIRQAHIVKPNSPQGRAVVQDSAGNVVYSL